MHVSELVAGELDPVVTATVFAAGQTGLNPADISATDLAPSSSWPEQSGSIIWCAPYDEVRQKYPSLPQAGEDHTCVDLTVTISCGRITEADFEGFSLAETFASLGLQDDADTATGLLGTPAKSASSALAKLMTTLLESDHVQ